MMVNLLKYLAIIIVNIINMIIILTYMWIHP